MLGQGPLRDCRLQILFLYGDRDKQALLGSFHKGMNPIYQGSALMAQSPLTWNLFNGVGLCSGDTIEWPFSAVTLAHGHPSHTKHKRMFSITSFSFSSWSIWGKGAQGKLLRGNTVALTSDKEGIERIKEIKHKFFWEGKDVCQPQSFETYTHLISKDIIHWGSRTALTNIPAI